MNKLLITVSWMVIFLSMTHSPVRGQLNGDTYQEAKSAGYATWTLTYAEAPGFAAETEKGISGITIDIMEKFREYVQEKEKIKIALKFEAQDP
ncbi:MAG: serine/threonine protein kinase, partial [Cytophagales bacterium]|nr:serine/threonine protein kinase [Cytophagales bacterium]